MTPRSPISFKGYTLYFSEHLGTVSGRAVRVSPERIDEERHPLDVIEVQKECWKQDASLAQAEESIKAVLIEKILEKVTSWAWPKAMAPCTRESIVEAYKAAYLINEGTAERPGTWQLSPITADWLRAWDLNPNATWEGAKIMGLPLVLNPAAPDGVLRLSCPAVAGQPAFERNLRVAAPVT